MTAVEAVATLVNDISAKQVAVAVAKIAGTGVAKAALFTIRNEGA